MNRQESGRRAQAEGVSPATLRLGTDQVFSKVGWAFHFVKLTMLFLCPSFIRNIVAKPGNNDLSAHGDGGTCTEKSQKTRRPDLDGLRGLAALSVFTLHLFSPFDLSLGSGYGSEPFTRTIFNLPIIRLLHAGQAMVKVFFVVSGYALTVKPAEYMISPQGGPAKLHQYLGVSILKRGIRLFLPPAVTTFCAMCLAYLGALMTREEIMMLPTGMMYLGIVRRQTFSLQVLDWARFVACKLANPWVWLVGGWQMGHSESAGEFSIYGPHLWTIQTEFRCSIVLFTVITAVAQITQTRLQELCSALIIVYCSASGRWDVALFISGMLSCIISARYHALPQTGRGNLTAHGTTDIEACRISSEQTAQTTECRPGSSHIEAYGDVRLGSPVHSAGLFGLSWWRGRGSRPRTRKPPQQRWFYIYLVFPKTVDGNVLSRIIRHLVLWMAFTASLWLLSYPERMRPGALGFEILRSINPDHDFWQSTGAVLLILVVGEIPFTQYILTGSVVQYLGKISFAFYLIHVPVLESIGWRVASAWRLAAGRVWEGNESGKTTVFLGPGTLSVASHAFMFTYVLLMVVYFADIVWMYVDRPTLALLRRLHSSLTHHTR